MPLLHSGLFLCFGLLRPGHRPKIRRASEFMEVHEVTPSLRLYAGDSSPGDRGAPSPDSFGRVPVAALKDSRLSDATIRVLAGIMSYYRGKVTSSSVVKVGRDAIGNVCAKGESSVYRAIVELEECGYLVRDRDRSRPGSPHCLWLRFSLIGAPSSLGEQPFTSEGLQPFTSEGLPLQPCMVDPSHVEACDPSLLKGSSLLRFMSVRDGEKIPETPPAPTCGQVHSSPASETGPVGSGPAVPAVPSRVASGVVAIETPESVFALCSDLGRGGEAASVARFVLGCGLRRGGIPVEWLPRELVQELVADRSLPAFGEPAVESSAKIPPPPAGGPALEIPAEASTPERIRTSNLRFRRPSVVHPSEPGS